MQKNDAKNFWKSIFGASRRVSFSYFPKVKPDHGVVPQYLTEFLWIIFITLFNSSPMQHQRWSSLGQEIGNSSKLLLTVVT